MKIEKMFLGTICGLFFGLGMCLLTFPWNPEKMSYDNHASAISCIIAFTILGFLISIYIEKNEKM